MQLGVVVGVLDDILFIYLIQRRHADVHVAVVDQLAHVAEEEGEQDAADVHAVLVGIREDDDLVVLQIVHAEVAAVARAQRRDDGADLLVGEHLVDALLFHVQRLAAQGQDGLRLPHARLLGRAARRIAFDDEQLVQLRLFARAGGELAHEGEVVDGVFGAGDLFGLPRRDAHARRPLRLFDDLFKHAFIARVFEQGGDALRRRRLHRLARLGVAQLCLGLPLELHVLHLDGEDGGEPFAEVFAQKVGVLVFEGAQRAGDFVQALGQAGAEARLVIAAFGGGDVVDEGEQAFGKFGGVLDGKFDEDAVLFRLIADGFGVQRRLSLVEVDGEVVQAAVELVIDGDGPLVFGHALVHQIDLQPLIEECQLFEPFGDGVEIEIDAVEHGSVRLEADEGASLVRLDARVAQVLFGHAAHEFFRLFVVIGAEGHSVHRAAVHLHLQPFGEGVGDGSAHAVQAARKGIVVLVELAARVQLGEHDLHARNARLGVDVGGDAAAVVLDRGAAVFVQFDLDAGGEAVGGLVDGVIDDLPQDMMQPLGPGGADVHARAQAHRV